MSMHGMARQSAPPATRRATTKPEPYHRPANASPSNQRVQAKLCVGRQDDPLEREADRAAERVLAGAAVGSLRTAATVPQRMCAECKGEETIQRQAVDEEAEEELQMKAEAGGPCTTGADAAAASVVTGGEPLSPELRTYFEPRFAHRFADVRVHTGVSAARAARGINARAYTLGRNIAFAAGQYAPDQPDGVRLLGHELAHVVQQRPGSCATIRRKTVKVKKRTFEVGEAKLDNKAAKDDVLKQGVLFPGQDQGHILVTGDGRLGYEKSYANPEDPYRWQKYKDIVDKGKIDIKAVSSTQTFPSLLIRGKSKTKIDISLAMLGGAGITLPRESLQRIVWAKAPTLTASADPKRDKIFYTARGSGRGVFTGNAMAHELFGHYWLVLNGVPFVHPPTVKEVMEKAKQNKQKLTGAQLLKIKQRFEHVGELKASHGIRDPFGNIYTGSVREYIDRFAGADTGRVESPTRRVGPAHLQAELKSLHSELLNPGGLKLNPNKIGDMSAKAAQHWTYVALNYEVLRQPPALKPGSKPASVRTPTPQPKPAPTQPAKSPPPAKSAADIVARIMSWYWKDFSADQKAAFENLVSTTLATQFTSGIPPQLAKDVSSAIQAHKNSLSKKKPKKKTP